MGVTFDERFLFLPNNSYFCIMKIYYLKNYGRFIGLSWVILYLTLVFQFMPQASLIEAIIYPALVLICCYPLTTYLSKKLLPKRMREKRLGLFFIEFFVLSIISGFIYFLWSLVFYLLEKYGIFPPSDLFMVDNPAYYIPTFLTAGLLINMIINGLRFYEEILKLQQQLYESQLYAMKAQITPHFMFNVLNHIYYYVETKDELATTLLLKYSDVLRYQLYSTKNETVHLQDEIQFTRDFVEIEKIRWEDKLDVNCKWEIDDPQLDIPPLILITLIENSFKHVSRNSDNRGFVNIYFKQNKQEISLEVENSKSSNSGTNKSNSGFGLENLKKRLDISHYGKYSLLINETATVYNSVLKITL